MIIILILIMTKETPDKIWAKFIFIAWWLALQWTYSRSWPRPFDDWKNVLFYAGAGCLLGHQLWKRRRAASLTVNYFSISLFLYAAFAILSLFGNHAPRYEGLLAVSRLFLWIGLVWVFSYWEKRRWEEIAKISVISASLIAILNFGQAHGYKVWSFSYFLIPPVGHVSYFGDFMALHLPLTFYLLASSRSFRWKILWGFCGLWIAMGLWISATRASMLGIGCAALLGLILLKRMRTVSWRGFMIAVAGMVLLTIGFHSIHPRSLRGDITLDRLKGFFKVGEFDIDALSSHRWKGYLTTVRMIGDKPLQGWGIGGFRFIYPEYDHKPPYNAGLSSASLWYMHPHNEILHQGMELGLFGLSAFLAIFLLIFFEATKQFRHKAADVSNDFMTLLGLAGLTVSLVSWQFSTNFLFPVSRILTAFYGGLLWRQLASGTRCWKRLQARGITIVLGILTVGSSLLLLNYHSALYLIGKGYRTNDPAEGLKFKRWAYHLAPRAFEPLFAYATAMSKSDASSESRYLLERLHAEFPFVPFVLYEVARSRIKAGKRAEAIIFLQHALANDPYFEPANRLLKDLESRQ